MKYQTLLIHFSLTATEMCDLSEEKQEDEETYALTIQMVTSNPWTFNRPSVRKLDGVTDVQTTSISDQTFTGVM